MGPKRNRFGSLKPPNDGARCNFELAEILSSLKFSKKHRPRAMFLMAGIRVISSLSNPKVKLLPNHA